MKTAIAMEKGFRTICWHSDRLTWTTTLSGDEGLARGRDTWAATLALAATLDRRIGLFRGSSPARDEEAQMSQDDSARNLRVRDFPSQEAQYSTAYDGSRADRLPATSVDESEASPTPLLPDVAYRLPEPSIEPAEPSPFAHDGTHVVAAGPRWRLNNIPRTSQTRSQPCFRPEETRPHGHGVRGDLRVRIPRSRPPR